MSYFDQHIKLTEYQNMGHEIVPGMIVRAFVGYIRIIAINTERGVVTEYIDEWGWHIKEKKNYVSRVLIEECLIRNPDTKFDTYNSILERMLFLKDGIVYMKDVLNLSYKHPFLNDNIISEEVYDGNPKIVEFDSNTLIEKV